MRSVVGPWHGGSVHQTIKDRSRGVECSPSVFGWKSQIDCPLIILQVPIPRREDFERASDSKRTQDGRT